MKFILDIFDSQRIGKKTAEIRCNNSNCIYYFFLPVHSKRFAYTLGQQCHRCKKGHLEFPVKWISE